MTSVSIRVATPASQLRLHAHRFVTFIGCLMGRNGVCLRDRKQNHVVQFGDTKYARIKSDRWKIPEFCGRDDLTAALYGQVGVWNL